MAWIAVALLFSVVVLGGKPTTSLSITPLVTYYPPQPIHPPPPSQFTPRSGLLPHTISKTQSTGYTLPLFKIPSALRPPRKKKQNQPPHYVKYWGLHNNRNQHKKTKKKKSHGWKMVRKESVFSPGYLVDLTERVLDGIGFLPEFSHVKNKNEGWAKHGKYVFKGITMHHGLYTSVL